MCLYDQIGTHQNSQNKIINLYTVKPVYKDYSRGRRGRMVVGFTSTCAIGVLGYHH